MRPYRPVKEKQVTAREVFEAYEKRVSALLKELERQDTANPGGVKWNKHYRP